MVRDLRRLADTRFDLVVVGAGFYGAIAAWDATLRGLSVALVDQGDFGGGTSFNNLKTLHGGLRSLQALNFRQMRLFIRERRALARVAPHLVRPMPFIVPTYGRLRRSAFVMRVALAVNDVVSRDRHQGLNDPGLELPPGEIVSRARCLELNPVIDPAGVTGGAVWHDYQLHNTDRMTLSFVLSAARAGAVTANYVRATRVLRDKGQVAGVAVQDALGGDAFEIRAPAVLNATGPWAASFLGSLESRLSSPAPRLSRAMNLVTRRVETGYGCGGLVQGRFLFLVPWRDVSILGTSHDAHPGGADAIAVTRQDLDTLIADAEAAFPGAHLGIDDIRLVHRGLLPMLSGHGRHVALLRESTVIDHARDGIRGLVSMFGVRYTTARATAASAVDAIFAGLNVPHPPASKTADTPVVGGAIENKERFLQLTLQQHAGVASVPALTRIALTYGTDYSMLVDLMRADPRLAEPIGERAAVTGAEILHGVRREAAVKLTDTLTRRTEAGSAGHPGEDAIARTAAFMAEELGWNPARTASEIADAELFYKLPT